MQNKLQPVINTFTTRGTLHISVSRFLLSFYISSRFLLLSFLFSPKQNLIGVLNEINILTLILNLNHNISSKLQHNRAAKQRSITTYP
jgi:hypothetical protein